MYQFVLITRVQVTGRELVYTALIGKPSEITYRKRNQQFILPCPRSCERDWKRNFMWPSIQRRQCPIHKGTLKALSDLVLIRMFLIWETDHFQVWFLYKDDLHISSAGKYVGLIELNNFKPRTRQYLQHFWSDKDFEGTVENRALPSLYEGSLKITITQSPKANVLSVYACSC